MDREYISSGTPGPRPAARNASENMGARDPVKVGCTPCSSEMGRRSGFLSFENRVVPHLLQQMPCVPSWTLYDRGGYNLP